MFDVSWEPAQAAYLAMVGLAMAAFTATLLWGMFYSSGRKK